MTKLVNCLCLAAFAANDMQFSSFAKHCRCADTSYGETTLCGGGAGHSAAEHSFEATSQREVRDIVDVRVTHVSVDEYSVQEGRIVAFFGRICHQEDDAQYLLLKNLCVCTWDSQRIDATHWVLCKK